MSADEGRVKLRYVLGKDINFMIQKSPNEILKFLKFNQFIDWERRELKHLSTYRKRNQKEILLVKAIENNRGQTERYFEKNIKCGVLD